MNWSDIASTVAKFAPLAGAALSSPVGAAIGVGTIIANLFGVDASPEQVLGYISENPDKAENILRTLQAVQERNRHEEQIKAIEFQNTDSARKNSANMNASPIDNQIKMILVVGMFLLLLICVSSYIVLHDEMNQTVVVSLGAIMGSLMTSIASMVNFYWGTSFSSQRKDEIIAKR